MFYSLSKWKRNIRIKSPVAVTDAVIGTVKADALTR